MRNRIFASLFALALTLSLLGLSGCAARDTAHDQAAVTEPELIDRDLLFGNPTRFQGRISPDGTKMSFRGPVDGVMNVWVGPLGDFDAAEPITHDTGRGIPAHFWALDSGHILYIQDRNGDENFHLYSVDLESGEEIDLTPYESVQAQFIAQSEDHPGIAVVGINDRDPRWHDVYRVDLATGERTLLAQNDGFASILVDNDLAVRAATRPTQEGGFDVLRWDEGEWSDLFTIPPEDSLATGSLGFDGENTGLYMIDSRGRDKAALTRVDLASGETEVVVASDGAAISDVLFDPRSHEPIAYAVNHTKRDWSPIGEAVAEDVTAISAAASGDFNVLAMTLDGSKWIVIDDAGDSSPVYAVWDREAGSLDEMFETRPDLEGSTLAAMHGVVIPSRDGKELVSYLTLPVVSDADGDARPNEPVPMVLLVHGGPWARDTFGYSGLVQWLANRGYAVLQVNFRASTGFGKEFINAGNKEWAAAMHDDLLDAVEWAVNEGITTSDQVAIMGGSYGGYATLVGLTFTPEVFACGVDIVGPSNLTTLLESIPPYWASIKRVFAEAIGDLETEEGQALLAERSPLSRADQIVRPLLIGQGANDPRVKQAEADQIVEAMKANGAAGDLRALPGRGSRLPQAREQHVVLRGDRGLPR